MRTRVDKKKRGSAWHFCMIEEQRQSDDSSSCGQSDETETRN